MMPGYGSTGAEIVQAALDRAAAGEHVDAAMVCDQLDQRLAANMGLLSEAAHTKPGPIIAALRSAGYRTPHEVLAAASGIVGSALVLMRPADRRRWLDVLIRTAQHAERPAGGQG